MLLGLNLEVEVEEGLVVVEVDGDLAVAVCLVGDGKGVAERDDAGLVVADTEEGTEYAVLVVVATEVSVEESREDERVRGEGGERTGGGREGRRGEGESEGHGCCLVVTEQAGGAS